MTLRRWAARAHKWIALVVGVQVFLWIAGGLVMSAFPLAQVRGEHRMAVKQPVAADPDNLISLAAAARAAGFESIDGVQLATFIGEPAYVLTSGAESALVSAADGRKLSPLDSAGALAAALEDYAGSGAARPPEWIEQPGIEYRGPAPVWRISFDGPEGENTYVDPYTGRITARRSDLWRVYDFFWMLHIMDYRERENSHHPLLVTAAGVGLMFSISGFVLLAIRMRAGILQRTGMAKSRRERKVN